TRQCFATAEDCASLMCPVAHTCYDDVTAGSDKPPPTTSTTVSTSTSTTSSTPSSTSTTTTTLAPFIDTGAPDGRAALPLDAAHFALVSFTMDRQRAVGGVEVFLDLGPGAHVTAYLTSNTGMYAQPGDVLAQKTVPSIADAFLNVLDEPVILFPG